MESLSALSRAVLIEELLSASPSSQVTGLEVCDKRPDTDQQIQRKLLVARELLLRELGERMRHGPALSSPNVMRDWLRLYCDKLEHEVFIVLYLDAQNRLIEAVEQFRGTLTQTSVYPREIVKGALAHNAACVALAHNHPSGEAEPSRADEALTQTLRSTLALVDVRVLDHFIVGGDQIVSFAEKGLL